MAVKKSADGKIVLDGAAKGIRERRVLTDPPVLPPDGIDHRIPVGAERDPYLEWVRVGLRNQAGATAALAEEVASYQERMATEIDAKLVWVREVFRTQQTTNADFNKAVDELKALIEALHELLKSSMINGDSIKHLEAHLILEAREGQRLLKEAEDSVKRSERQALVKELKKEAIKKGFWAVLAIIGIIIWTGFKVEFKKTMGL